MKSKSTMPDKMSYGYASLKMRWFAALCLCTLALSGAGCGGASTEQMQLMRSEIFTIKQDQRQLQHQVTVLDSLIRQRVEGLDQFNAGFGADVRQLTDHLATLGQRLKDTEQRLNDMAGRMQTASSSAAPASGGQPAAKTGPGPREMYDLAYKDFTSSNYQLAVEGFSDFVQRYPDTPLAAQAYLYLGNCYQALNKYEQAISSYKSIVDRYPDSQLHPDALFKIGDSLIKLGDVARGETYFQGVIQKFPDSNAAELARARLNQ